LIDAGQTMRGIFDAVTFRQQRGWFISLAAPHQAVAVAWAINLIAEPEGPSFISSTVAPRRVDRRCS
jgi:hypothetical protein